MSQNNDAVRDVPLRFEQYVMVADEPFPGVITGCGDDGMIGVKFDGVRHRHVHRTDIVWIGR